MLSHSFKTLPSSIHAWRCPERRYVVVVQTMNKSCDGFGKLPLLYPLQSWDCLQGLLSSHSICTLGTLASLFPHTHPPRLRRCRFTHFMRTRRTIETHAREKNCFKEAAQTHTQKSSPKSVERALPGSLQPEEWREASDIESLSHPSTHHRLKEGETYHGGRKRTVEANLKGRRTVAE